MRASDEGSTGVQKNKQGHSLIQGFSRLSIRRKLFIAFMTVALIPLSLYFFLNHRDTQATLTETANQALLSASSQTALLVDSFISNNLNSIGTEAQLPDFIKLLSLPEDRRKGSTEEADAISALYSLSRKDLANISSFGLLDSEGLTVIDTFTPDIGTSKSREDYFRNTVAAGVPYASPVEFLNRDSPSIYFSAPVRDTAAGKIIGVLYLRYSASVLEQIIVQTGELGGRQSYAILLDENYICLAHGTSPKLIFTKIMPFQTDDSHGQQTALLDFKQVLLKADEQPFFTIDLGTSHSQMNPAAVVKLMTKPWYIIFVQPQPAFLTSVRERGRMALLIGMVLVLMVSLLATGMARILTSPITHLTTVARQVAQGDFHTKAKVESVDEVGVLGEAFNVMTSRLMETLEGLQESEERYHLVFENSPVSIWEADFSGIRSYFNTLKKEGIIDIRNYFTRHPEEVQQCIALAKIVDVNQAALSLHGAENKEELKENLFKISTTVSLENFKNEMIHLWNGETEMINDTVVKTLGGIPRNVTIFVSVCPGFEESLGRIFVSIIDITERMKVEDALESTARRLTEAQRLAHIGSWELNIQENKLSYTDEIYRIFETVPETLGTTYEGLLEYIHPEDRDAVRTAYMNSLHNKTPYTNEHRLLLPNGQIKYIYEHCETYYEKDMPMNSFGTIQDITGRKMLEEQLRQSQKMEAVGQLAGGVAHDFNNMLGVILGCTDLALEGSSHDALHENLMHIKEAGERSAEITHQLLAFARKQTIQPRVINLNETIKGMFKLLQRLIGENIRLTRKACDDLWAVYMDTSQINQILTNLCLNAKDAITDTGIISFEMKNIYFEDSIYLSTQGVTPGEFVQLIVSDNGKGMDKQTLNNIFDPFFTTKEIGKGTGLGLSTVYGIVRQNSGFINVYSEPGIGSTFKIYLPRYVDKIKGPAEEDHSTIASRGSETILLVEDDALVIDMVRQMLKSFGYHVLSTSSAGEAIKLVEENSGNIDLLVTDMIMPEMTGLDLYREVNTSSSPMRCLFMSGYMPDIITSQGILDEKTNFIQKPFSMKDLAEKVREILDR